jgi:hypothetical protein
MRHYCRLVLAAWGEGVVQGGGDVNNVLGAATWFFIFYNSLLFAITLNLTTLESITE